MADINSGGISILPAPSIQLARSLASTSVDDLNALSPYQLFQKQMESGSTEACLDAMKRLSVVAITMGAPEVQSELIPYLTALVTQPVTTSGMPAASANSSNNFPPPTDELLLILGQELKLVAQFYLQHGDSKTHVPEDFLPILERLAAVEETVVRDQAVEVFAFLAEKGVKHVSATWMALIKRLVNADWFTPKVSAAGILPHLFGIVTDGKNRATSGSPHQGALELLSLYKELCTDETPMVRRAAAQHLGLVLKESGWIYAQVDGGLAITTLTKLCNDEQDSVRRLAVVALAQASPVYAEQNAQWTAQHWLPLLKEASTDLSWYVLLEEDIRCSIRMRLD